MYKVIRRDELGSEATIDSYTSHKEAKKAVKDLDKRYPDCHFWVEKVVRT